MDKSVISLTLLLEGVLLSTYRQEALANNGNIKHFQGGNSTMKNLNSSNISEIICTRLSEGKEYGGAVGYLCGCFKRLQQKEQSCDDKIRPELASCRKQIITFVASSILEKDLFGPNSEESLNDLYNLLSYDIGGGMLQFMKELADEFVEQDALTQVTNDLVTKIFDALGLKSNPMGPYSMLENSQELAMCALQTLFKSDKRFTKAMPSVPNCFDLQEKFLSLQVPYQFQNTPAHMIHPSFIEKFGTAGVAVEHTTLLGRILRISPSIQDPAIMNLLGKTHKQTRAVAETNVSNLRSKVNLATGCASELVLAILKCGGDSKQSAMNWLINSISLNAEAEKDHPSPFLSSTHGFLINLNSLFLSICQPIINDIEKLKKVQITYLTNKDSKSIFPADCTKLVPVASLTNDFGPSSSLNGNSSDESMSFITQSFFMCWRSLHLGYTQQCDQYYNNLRGLSHFHEGLSTDEPRSIHYLVRKICFDVQLFNPLILTDIVKFCSCAAYVLLVALTSSPSDQSKSSTTVFSFSGLQGQTQLQLPSQQQEQIASSSTKSWLLLPNGMSENHKRVLVSLPEHLVEDIMTILCTIARTEPSYLATLTVTNSLEPILSLIIFFLRRPWAVQSPHLRAKFGLVLFHVFLPSSRRKSEDMWTHATSADGPHTNLLDNMIEAQEFLAPTLLLLYGDVEKTGFYEKLTNRRSIMIVLKHLWSLPSHRSAFRGIASMNSSNSNNTNTVPVNSTDTDTQTTASLDETTMYGASSSSSIDDRSHNYFIRFANGLMNETNALVTTTIEKLQEIKKIQTLMKNPTEWSQLGEEGQTQMKEKLDQCEREVKGTAGLCIETLNMLNYLTSDEVIRIPFLMEEILPRFTSMLLSVLNKIIGPKSLEIKVDNIQSYNFDPKAVLVEICQAMIHFAEFPLFYETIAKDGFYGNGVTLKKTIATVEKLNTMTLSEVEILKQLYENSQQAKANSLDFDALTADAPEEFLDALLFTFMRDPVKLPTSGNVVDKSTIAQHLLNDETDPFNRQPLQLSEIIPLPDLKQRIEDWIKSKMEVVQ